MSLNFRDKFNLLRVSGRGGTRDSVVVVSRLVIRDWVRNEEVELRPLLIFDST